MRTVIYLILALPAAAEFREVRFTIDDTGCASCAESLKSRLGRVRGVASVAVESDGRVAVRLAAGNRTRVEQLRDFVAQGGNQVRRIAVIAEGRITETDGARWFEPSGLAARYRVEGGSPGAGLLEAEADAKLETFRAARWTPQP